MLKNKWLLLIVVLAFVVRVVGLDLLPPSLNWDEVSHGYNAYSILKTGKDEWGKFLPTIFRAYGDYKLPVYIYITTVPVYLFGLSAFSVRIASVLAGSFSVLFTYLLTEKLFGKREVSLLSAFFVAISPWSLFLSRIALEGNFAFFLIVAGAYFGVLGVRVKNAKYLIVSSLFLGLSVWTYNSARIFSPLVILAFCAVYWRELRRLWRSRFAKLAAIVLILFFIPMLAQFFEGQGLARYANVQIIDEGVVGEIIKARESSFLPREMSRLIYNRPISFAKIFAQNYLSHFSPSFLFTNGGDHYQFSVQGHGLVYLANLPLFVLGLYVLFRNVFLRKKEYVFVFMWFLFGPVASSLTREAPHVLRDVTTLPVPMIVSALGFSFIWGFIKGENWRYLPLSLYALALFFGAENYMTAYANDYRNTYSWAWQYGYKEAVDYVKNNYDKYEKIVFTKKYGEPHEFLLFYWPWEPDAYTSDSNLVRFNQSNWWWVDSFDKFYFVNDWEIPSEANTIFTLESGTTFKCNIRGADCLLVTSPGNAPKNWIKLTTIYFLDLSPAFEIYANN